MKKLLPGKEERGFEIKQVIAFVYKDDKGDEFFVPIKLVSNNINPAIAADQEGLEIIKTLIKPWMEAHPRLEIRALRMTVTEDITDQIFYYKTENNG